MLRNGTDVDLAKTERHLRANILGVGVSALNMERALKLCDEHLQGGGRGYVCVTGVHGIMEAQSDAGFRRIQNASLLTTPDGMPTVWLGHLQGHRDMDRVYGPDFMLEFCRLSVERGYRHYLYGGQPGVAERLKESLERRFPGITIAGVYAPPFRPLRPEEEDALRRDLERSKSDILWCGLSTPKQERFMAQYVDRLPVKLMVGVGAAFDINSGRTADAPQWVKRMGMQWLHRLLHEPRRLWRRYLYNNPRFVWLALLQMTGLRRYEFES